MKKQKTKNKILTFEIPVHIYTCIKLYVIVSEDGVITQKTIKRFLPVDDEESLDYFLGCTFHNENVIVLYLKNKKDLKVLIHECVHIATYIADYVGLEFIAGKSNEWFTYLIDDLYLRIKEKLKE